MKIKLIISILLCFPAILFARTKPVRIAINESKPYVMFHKDHDSVTRCSGITVDVLHYLFNENIEYVYCKSKQEVINMVKANKADVGANVTLTVDRMQGLSYSLPYLETNVGVMTKKITQPTLLESFWIGIQNEKFVISLLQITMIIIGLFMFTGTILYIIEYRSSKKGYFQACYMSFVSISFLAGLENEPVKKSSKIILVFITFLYAVTFAPYLTAYLTAQIQEQNNSQSKFTSIDQLKYTNVYTTANTSNELVLSENNIEYITANTDSISSEVIKGRAVYVHDKNVLENYIHEHKLGDKLTLSPIVIRKSSRVFIYSTKFRFNKEAYDVILVKMKNIGKIDQMASRYGISP